MSGDFDDQWATLGGEDLASAWASGTTLGSPPGRSAEIPTLPPVALSGDAAELELGPPLGEGAIGLVLDARQRALDRPVAVKCLKSARAGDAALLVREARLAGRLEHPNIVPIHTLGADPEGQPVVVMKRVEGESWRRRLAHSDDLEAHLRVLMQVCQAIHFAHERGVLHRDLKPENVMLGRYGEVYVVDWGLALEIEGARTRGLAGTPGYLAPEMVKDDAPLDARTDVYLLGAILHELISGQRRQPGRDLKAVCALAHRSAPVDYSADVPARLGAIANRACARAPAARYPSAESLRLALAEYLVHREVYALLDRAEARLEALRAADEDEVEGLFGACRFGFEEALRLWPDSDRAQAGLDETLRIMITRDLDAGEAGAAARLVRALPTSDPALETRVEAERRRLAELKDVRDPERGQAARLKLHLTLALLLGVVPMVVGPLRRAGHIPPAAEPLRRAAAPLIVAVLLALYLRRRADWQTDSYNRRVGLGLLLMLLGTSVTWTLTGLFGGEMHQALSHVLLNAAFLCGAFGLLLDRRFLVLAPLQATGALVSAFTGYSEEMLGLVNLLSITWLYFAWSGRLIPSLSIRR